jgi:hypothetical protein
LFLRQLLGNSANMSTITLQGGGVGVQAFVPDFAIGPEISQIIELATGTSTSPTISQLSGWEAYEASGGSLASIAAAFVGSTAFANTFNGGTPVDPNSPITSTVANGIIEHALGAATATQVNAWASTGLSLSQVFQSFALGDQFAATEATQNATNNGIIFSSLALPSPTIIVLAGVAPVIIDKGELTGGTTSGGTSIAGISMPTLSGIKAGDKIVFDNATNESLANIAGTDQVNVTSAHSLAQALDLAASDASASEPGGAIPGHTGLLDWFQYGSDTYVVEAINPTSTPADQTELTATDAVIQLVGLIDLSNSQFAGSTLTI